MEGWWAASYAVLWGLVVLLCVVVVALARQIGTLHLRLGPRGALEIDDEGPPLGEMPPPATADTLDGATIDLTAPGRARVLAFVSPGCMVCEQVLPGLGAAAAGFDAYALTDVDAHETRRAFGGVAGVTVAAAPDAARTWGVPGTPYVVVVDAHAVVRAKGTVNNLEQLEGLVDTARRRTASLHEAHR